MNDIIEQVRKGIIDSLCEGILTRESEEQIVAQFFNLPIDMPCKECNGRGWVMHFRENKYSVSCSNQTCHTCEGTGKTITTVKQLIAEEYER